MFLTCGGRLVERVTQLPPNIRFAPRRRSRPRVRAAHFDPDPDGAIGSAQAPPEH